MEQCAQLDEMSVDMRTKSKQLLAKNLQQTQAFFDKLKAFIDFLSLPNYSKEEVRHKRALADRITRLMFEEEQRLRRGLELSEMQKLDKLLGPVASASRQRPKSAYAAPPGPHQVAGGGAVGHQQVVQLAHGGNLPLSLPQPPQQNPTSSISSESSEKPVLRRERTFDLDVSSSVFQAEAAARAKKKQHRQSCPPRAAQDSGGWMEEAAKTESERHKAEPPDPGLVDDFNLLGYFQQQRLEHTRLLRSEIQRLEGLERLCLSSINQAKERGTAKTREEGRKKEKEKEEKKKKRVEDRRGGAEEEKRRRRSSRKLKENLPNGSKVEVVGDGQQGLERADTYTKKERRQAAAKLSLYREEGRGRANSHSREVLRQQSAEGSQEVARMTTSFKEVADRKLRQETSPVLTRSGPNSPMSWYIPSDPPSRATSKLSTNSRQTSVEESANSQGSYGSPPPATSSRGDQTSRGGSETFRAPRPTLPHSRHFGHQMPSRQASQGSPPPASRNQGMQTGSSLLKMFLKKADKGNQVQAQPQAFFLPLADEGDEGSSNVIDLEVTGETEETDLQRALRQRRPDYIAAAEERAGRLSKGAAERSQKGATLTSQTEMTRSTEGRGAQQRPSKPPVLTMKRSQSSPRVSSILKPSPPGSGGSGGRAGGSSGIPRRRTGEPVEPRKSVTISQTNGDGPRHKPGVAVLRSRTGMGKGPASQHYNIKNIYGADKAIKAKVY